jgi:hypothetical protein
LVALIVDGADPEALDRLKGRIPDGFMAIPDPGGAIASHFGIRIWPTAVRVIDGFITAVDVGVEPSRPMPPTESAS